MKNKLIHMYVANPIGITTEELASIDIEDNPGWKNVNNQLPSVWLPNVGVDNKGGVEAIGKIIWSTIH